MFLKVSQLKDAAMYNIPHVPQLTCNLFYVRAAACKGNFIKFGHSRCWIQDTDGRLAVWERQLIDKLYRLECKAVHAEAATFTHTQKDKIIFL